MKVASPNIFDGINSMSKTQYTSYYSWIISIVYLISWMIKYRVNSTGLHSSVLSLSFTSVHTLLGFLPCISIIFFHLLLNCFVFFWALLLNHLVLYLYFLSEYCLSYFAPVTATDLLASSLPAIITFLRTIPRYFKEDQEKAFTGKSFVVCNKR